MPHPLFTASEIDRLMQCSGSASLLQLKNHSAAGQLGTQQHARYLKPNGLPKNCRLWLCGGDPKNAPQDSTDRFEASFEYYSHDQHAQYLGSNLERAYLLSRPNGTSGTADVWNWWVDAAGLHIRVADLKTGWGQASGDLPEPWDSWQLRWYAMAVWRSLRNRMANTQTFCGFCGNEVDRDCCWCGTSTADHRGEEHSFVPVGCECMRHDFVPLWRQPLASLRVAWFVPNELDQLEIIEAHRDFTTRDLETFNQALIELTDRLTSQTQATWRTGPWCGRCHALSVCPMQRGIVERLGFAVESEITAETIVSLWRSKKAIESLLNQADELITNYLSNGQLETRPGYALGLQPRRNKSLAPDALERAKLVLGDSTPVKQSLDLEAVPVDALPKLHEVGAIRITSSSAVREYRIKGGKE